MAKYYVVKTISGRWKSAREKMIWGADHKFRTVVEARNSRSAIAKAKKLYES